MTKSIFVYHPSILHNKRETIKKANDLINETKNKIIINAKKIISCKQGM